MPRRASPGRLTILERAEDLPPLWDNLVRGHALALESRFVRAVQPNVADGSNRRFLIYEAANGATVVATAVLLETSSARNPVASVLLGRLAGHVPSGQRWMLPMLLLRAELIADTPYRTNASPAQRAEAMRGLVAALGQHAKRERCSIAIDCVAADDFDMTTALSEAGYLRTVARPFASMRIVWDSWDAYLKSAARHSKHTATNIRTECNRARRDGLAIVDWSATDTPESELYRLMVEHERRLNNRESLFGPGLLGRLKETLGNDLKVLLGTRNDQLQGFVAFARTGNRGYVTYPGLVEKAERARALYFNLLFYQPIRIAIELGLESLEFGNAALEPKIRRGCTVQAGALCFRPRERIVSLALGAPVALHRRALQRKYAPVLRAVPFSNIALNAHANSTDERAS